MALEHLVLWKFKDDATEEAIAAACEACVALKAVIPVSVTLREDQFPP